MNIVSLNNKKKLLKKSHYKCYDYNYFYFMSKLVGRLIFRGKKLFAYNFFLNFKYQLKLLENKDPYFVFLVAMLNVSPILILFAKRLGGMQKEIPMPLHEKKQAFFALKWTIQLLKKEHKYVKLMDLVELIVDSFNFKGKAIQIKWRDYNIGIQNRFLLKFIKK